MDIGLTNKRSHMLYACDKCRFLFESDEDNVVQCPDCGKMKVRAATEEETADDK